MGEFVRVASASAIPPNEMITVEIDGQEIVIANTGDGFSPSRTTAHTARARSGEGILTGDVVECPFHGGQFNVANGRSGGIAAVGADCDLRRAGRRRRHQRREAILVE